MATGQTPHVVVAGALPSTVGAASAVCDRLRDTGLVVSRAAACGRARRRITDGRADMLLVAGTEDGADELVAAAGEKGVPCCVVGDAAAPSTDADVVTVTASGPDPVARLAGVLHELATNEPRPTNEPALEEAATTVHAAVEPDGTPPSTARVLDEAPVGITVSDMRQPDEPLVYVNDKFVEQTGYSHEAAIGRNCRFLQGPATAAEPVKRMRQAIEAGESVTVELRNYSQSGELFWQEVSLAPIRDGAGNITHYAGFQADVTRRKRAERAADRHRAALAEERKTFQSLLQRLGGVVEQVTGAVVEAGTRSALGETTCSRLGDTYAAAWLATYDPASERVEPNWTAVSSLGDDPGETLGAVSLGDGPSVVPTDGGTTVSECDDGAARPEPALLAEAVETRTVAMAEDVEWHPAVREVAAVPVTYRDTLFGLLCVYTDDETSFGREESALLASIGRSIGIGLNAIDSQSSLTTDSGFEVEFTVASSELPLVRLAEEADCSLQQAGVVPDETGRSVLCTASGATAAELGAAADVVPGVRSWTCLAEREQNPLFEFDLCELPLLDAVGAHGLRLADLRVDVGRETIVARGAREASARALVAAVEEQFGRVDVRGFRERPARETTVTEFVVDVDERLTDRQRHALTVATAAGYFEWPRDTDGNELAESFGVARSTFHQHLRAALRKVVEAFHEAVGPVAEQP